MPSTSVNSTEEIIEKRASAPVATTCLILSCAALLVAIVFQVIELAQYRSGTTPASISRGWGQDKAKKDMGAFKADVERIRAECAQVLGTAKVEEGAEDTSSTEPPTSSTDTSSTDATAKEKEAAPADEVKAEEPKAEEPKAEAEEPKAEEPKAEAEEPKAEEPEAEAKK